MDKKYNGKNIEYIVCEWVTIWMGYKIECSDRFIIKSMNGVPNNQYTGSDSENYIYIDKKRDGFIYIENFCKGVEFIDKYATPTVRQKCFDELIKLDCQCKELDNIMRKKYISFFCTVGEWNDNDSESCDKDFEKYLFNCSRFYEIPID